MESTAERKDMRIRSPQKRRRMPRRRRGRPISNRLEVMMKKNQKYRGDKGEDTKVGSLTETERRSDEVENEGLSQEMVVGSSMGHEAEAELEGEEGILARGLSL